MFQLRFRDGLGRVAELKTKHGVVETPTLLPVVNPNQIVIPPKEMSTNFGTSIVITNAYIIYRNRELKEEALSGGIHSLLDFEGPIMTDSGTFQSHIYGKVSVSNEEIVHFQRDIGSDIGSVLDVFSEPHCPREEAVEAIEETIRRAREASESKGEMALAAGIQGSTYPDLRERCASEISRIPIDVNAIGGVVPVMENYQFSTLVDIILSAKKGLLPGKPVHLYGAGHPMIFALTTLLGCDMFDSSSYAKYAKDGRMMFLDGTRRVDELMHQICHCPVCSNLSLKELRGDEVAIAKHNLYVSYSEIERIKQAIYEGSLWELVERRCFSHPNMLSALRELRKYWQYLERFESTSKKSSFYFTSVESLYRPLIMRYLARLRTRYSPPTRKIAVVFPEAEKPYSIHYKKELETLRGRVNSSFFVQSVLGPVPLELEEMYPLAQSLVPHSIDARTKEVAKERTSEFLAHLGFERTVYWEDEGSKAMLEELEIVKAGMDIDVLKLRALADMQFGKGAGSALIGEDVRTVKSKKTGKIRNVLLGDKHILSLRARDGMFTLKAEGARILHKEFTFPRIRVVVENSTAESNREGRNVFARFVRECDEGIRPMDEVLVVNEDDELVAVARALLNREEMLSFSCGVAARVREGIPRV